MGIIGSDSLALLAFTVFRARRSMNTLVGTDCGLYHFETVTLSFNEASSTTTVHKTFRHHQVRLYALLDKLSENSSILVLRFWVPIKALPQ